MLQTCHNNNIVNDKNKCNTIIVVVAKTINIIRNIICINNNSITGFIIIMMIMITIQRTQSTAANKIFATEVLENTNKI